MEKLEKCQRQECWKEPLKVVVKMNGRERLFYSLFSSSEKLIVIIFGLSGKSLGHDEMLSILAMKLATRGQYHNSSIANQQLVFKS